MAVKKVIICAREGCSDEVLYNEYRDKTTNSLFCSFECLLRDKYKNNPERLAEVLSFPTYICQRCGEKIKLDFDPCLSIWKWNRFTCPKCGYQPNKINLAKYY